MTPVEGSPGPWYLTPWGRVGRMVLALGTFGLAGYLYWLGGAAGVIGGVLVTFMGLSLAWATVVQEPD